jgi:hypothetical protein
MNLILSYYPAIKVTWFDGLSKKEGTGVNPAPSNYSLLKSYGLMNEVRKKVLGERTY